MSPFHSLPSIAIARSTRLSRTLLTTTRLLANFHLLTSLTTIFFRIPTPSNLALNLLRSLILILPTLWIFLTAIYFQYWLSDQKLHTLVSIFIHQYRELSDEEIQDRVDHPEETYVFILRGQRCLTALAFSMGKVWVGLGWVVLRFLGTRVIGGVGIMGDPAESMWWVRVGFKLGVWGVVLAGVGFAVVMGGVVVDELWRLGDEAGEEALKGVKR